MERFREGGGMMPDGADFFDKFIDVFEVAVDGRKADVCHFVIFADFLHGAASDFAGGDFAVKVGFDGRNDRVNDLVDDFRLNVAFPAGFFDAGTDFCAIQVFECAIALDDLQFRLNDGFVGCESMPASIAFPAPAYSGTVS